MRSWRPRGAGPGWSTRPATSCETCTYFQTSIEFRATLQAQHDDAIAEDQDHRGQLFTSLLARIDQDAS